MPYRGGNSGERKMCEVASRTTNVEGPDGIE